jgi:hypothetical protein
VQRGGGPAETAVADHGVEVGQLAQLHRFIVTGYESQRKDVLDARGVPVAGWWA